MRKEVGVLEGKETGKKGGKGEQENCQCGVVVLLAEACRRRGICWAMGRRHTSKMPQREAIQRTAS
jgi:hypothetical protein